MNADQMVSIRFLGLRMEGEFWAFLVSTLLIGMSIGWFVTYMSSLKYRIRNRQLDKKIAKTELAKTE